MIYIYIYICISVSTNLPIKTHSTCTVASNHPPGHTFESPKETRSDLTLLYRQAADRSAVNRHIRMPFALWHCASSQAFAYWKSRMFSIKWHLLETSMASLKANIWVTLAWLTNSTSLRHSCHFRNPVQCVTSRHVGRGHPIGYIFMKLAAFYDIFGSAFLKGFTLEIKTFSNAIKNFFV